MDLKELISVIVPVYNAEPYIDACAESVLRIGMDNLELILIDDGSTDQSAIRCDRIAAKDSRVHVLHDRNGGVSAARNHGIEAAEGRYVFFLDADDRLLPEALEKAELSSSELDLENSVHSFIAFSYVSGFPDGREKREDFPFAGVICSDPETLKHILLGTPLLKTCWGKLFRRDLLLKHHLFFPEHIAVGEDYVFVMRYLEVLFREEGENSIQLINSPVVWYRQNAGGAMGSLNLEKHISGLQYVWEEGKRVTAGAAFSAYRNDFSIQEFETLMYYFRMIAVRFPRTEAVGNIRDILQFPFVKEMETFTLQADPQGYRGRELRLVSSGNAERIYSYVRLKGSLRKVLKKE